MRILLVEDDENLAKALTAVLSKHNYILDVSTDGEMGWEMINIISYDLVLLDVMLTIKSHIRRICQKLKEVGAEDLIETLPKTYQDLEISRFSKNLISNLQMSESFNFGFNSKHNLSGKT